MNAASTFASGIYVLTYELDNQQMKFTRADAAQSFFLVNDDLLHTPAFQSSLIPRTGTAATPYNINYKNPQSLMQLLGLGKRGSRNTLWPELFRLLQGSTLGTEFFTPAVDVRRHHCIYLHSPTLTNFRVLGPSGSRSCIARVPVTSGYGSILTSQHSGHVLDSIPCGGVTLRTLQFELRNAYNQPVDLRGGHISFSIIFSANAIFFKKNINIK